MLVTHITSEAEISSEKVEVQFQKSKKFLCTLGELTYFLFSKNIGL